MLDRWVYFARLADMKTIRLVVAFGVLLLVASCATLRDTLPTKPGPSEPVAPVEVVLPEPEPEPPKPLAAGDVRITIVAAEAVPAFRVKDNGEAIGVIQGGGSLQWDRPGGIAELQADPVSNREDAVRFIGLFMPGEWELPLGSNVDGSLSFAGGKAVRLSEARRLSRLRRRAQRLPLETALAYLNEHLFAAPAPGRLRSAYADADQKIVASSNGPVLTWSRYDARGGSIAKKAGGRERKHRKSMTHAFADFVDADIRLGFTARVAFRRNVRDIEPARVFFRLTGDGSVTSKLESLIVALMVCCPDESR
jgi:hypothetical protein